MGRKANDNLPAYDDIVAFIKSHWQAHCYGPTIREITKACNISSTSVTVYYLERLEEQGRITTHGCMDGDNAFLARIIRTTDMRIYFADEVVIASE